MLFSRFLELPRELRDMICDWALTSKSGLEAHIDGEMDKVYDFYDMSLPHHGSPEFNQLQFVSKQFSAETRGFSMKNNTLYITGEVNEFVSKNMVQGIDLVIRFLEECSPRIKAKIRDLRIFNYFCDPPGGLSLAPGIRRYFPPVLSLYFYDDSVLSRFSQQYPRAQISMRSYDFTEEWVMSFGVMYHYYNTCKRQ